MTVAFRFTSADLERFPDIEGVRYEIIDGELYVSRQPSVQHQIVCSRMSFACERWNQETGAGFAMVAPGVIFAEDNEVAPDLVWVSKERLAQILGPEGHLHGAPELVVEVLSPGPANQTRDRVAKLDLYSRRGVGEYWIVDWEHEQVAVYRRAGMALDLVATLRPQDTLGSPLLPTSRSWSASCSPTSPPPDWPSVGLPEASHLFAARNETRAKYPRRL